MAVLDDAGRSPLHCAALTDDVESARELLAAGADSDLPDRRRFTPLHFAAQANAEAVARLLLDHAAKGHPVDSFGNTPLFTAVFNSKGSGNIIALLRQCGADAFHASTKLGLARLIDNYDVARFFSDLPLPLWESPAKSTLLLAMRPFELLV